MTIDRSTQIKLHNKYTNYVETCYLSELVESNILNSVIKQIMTVPTQVGNLLSITLTGEHAYSFISPGRAIKNLCLYIAVCCFVGKTDFCKSLIDDLVDTYDISIKYSKAKCDAKDIVKEIVTLTVDENEILFEQAAKKLGII